MSQGQWSVGLKKLPNLYGQQEEEYGPIVKVSVRNSVTSIGSVKETVPNRLYLRVE